MPSKYSTFMERKVLLAFTAALFLILEISIVSATIESDFLSLINSERASQGKLPVYINSNLTQSAYLHSKDMADNNYFSHNSFDNSTFDKRIKAAGYVNSMALGENIAYASGDASADKAFDMWKNSPGHYANMISDSFNEIGLGFYTKNGLSYYTLDLGKRFNFIPPKANETNPEILFSLISVDESKSKYYKFIKVGGNLNKKSSVYYYIDGKSQRICSNCNKFSISIRTKISNNQLILKASNDTRTIEI
jgi:hypothetical protein